MWLWLLKIPTHFLMTMLTVILWYCCWCWWRSRCCWRQQLCQRHLMVSFVTDRIEGTVKWVTSWAVSSWIADSAQTEYCTTFHFPSVCISVHVTSHISLIYIGISAIQCVRGPIKPYIYTETNSSWLCIPDQSTTQHNITKRTVYNLYFCTDHLNDH